MPEDYSQGWIDFGAINPANLIRLLHELSSAQGLGFIHDSSRPLTDEDLKYWLDQLKSEGRADLDYVRGRSVKKSIHKHNGHYLIREGAWYDHRDAEFNELLARFGLSREQEEPHIPTCQCDDCKPNHPSRKRDQALGMTDLTLEGFSKETNR